MWKAALTALAVATLAGCASTYQLSNDVSTYSQWPAGRKPATYAFERLPSQQTDPKRQQMLEDAARPAVEAAGFKPAADLASADVHVQLSARVSADERALYPDPFWWNAGFYYGRRGFRHGFYGPTFGFRYATPAWYEREVALLIRDRKTGQAIFETRATSDGNSSMIEGLLPAMFEAAMKDFPTGGVNPRRVVTTVQPVAKTP